MSAKADHDKNAQRYAANKIYVRALARRSDLIPKVSSVDFGTAFPGDANVGSAVYNEQAGIVYFNEDGGGVFILLADDEEAELTAGANEIGE